MKAFDNALPIIVVKYRQMKLPAVSSTNRYLSVPKEMARKVRVEEPRIIALITQMRFLERMCKDWLRRTLSGSALSLVSLGREKRQVSAP